VNGGIGSSQQLGFSPKACFPIPPLQLKRPPLVTSYWVNEELHFKALSLRNLGFGLTSNFFAFSDLFFQY